MDYQHQMQIANQVANHLIKQFLGNDDQQLITTVVRFLWAENDSNNITLSDVNDICALADEIFEDIYARPETQAAYHDYWKANPISYNPIS